MDVGVVGLGAIGRQVCRALDEGIPGLRLAGATARDRAKAERFLKDLRSPAPFLSLDALVEASNLVVEASTQKHLEEIAPTALKAGRDLVVLSCGGLLGRQDWVDVAAANHCRILVPSGAIAGLDGVKGARIGAITSVTMESRKPPRGLAGAPWIEQQMIDLDAITQETLIFEGPATEACRAFPANVNVVAALSLAGIGPEKTRIKIFASPERPLNRHRISVEGEFGRLTIEESRQLVDPQSNQPSTGHYAVVVSRNDVSLCAITVTAEPLSSSAVTASINGTFRGIINPLFPANTFIIVLSDEEGNRVSSRFNVMVTC